MELRHFRVELDALFESGAAFGAFVLLPEGPAEETPCERVGGRADGRAAEDSLGLRPLLRLDQRVAELQENHEESGERRERFFESADSARGVVPTRDTPSPRST